MATPNIVPRADSEGGLGTASKYWASAYIDTITTTGKIQCGGEIEGGSLDINGNADIAGNLVISGTTALDVTGNVNDNWAGRFENTNSGGFGALVKIAGTSANEKVFEARVGDNTKMVVTGDGNATFAGDITTSSGNPFVTIEGNSAGYVNGGIQFISNHASDDRGLGTFYYNAHTDVEWFAGLPYSSNDAFVINRNASYTAPSSESSPAGIGASAGTLFSISSSGNATFAGTVLINNVSNYTGLTVKGSGTSRPAVNFTNATQGNLGTIFGTEASAVSIGTGASGVIALTLDSSQNATFTGDVTIPGSAVTTGENNTALGGSALATNQTGDRNTAIGGNALATSNATDTNGDNVAVGYNAGASLSTGTHNVMLGNYAGDGFQVGQQNVAIGSFALSADNAGDYSVAVGTFALSAQNAGSDGVDMYNVAVGHSAGAAVQTGLYNTIVGGEALSTNIDGDANTAVGYKAMKQFEADTDGHGENTAFGAYAMRGDDTTPGTSTGTQNTAIGANAMKEGVLTGNHNTAVF